MSTTATCCTCGASWWYRDLTPAQVREDRCLFCRGILQIEDEDAAADETARRLVASALGGDDDE